MSVFIVFFGTLIALAGGVALGFGVQNWAFGIGNTLIASGSVGLIGGLLLMGIGLVLRSLRALGLRIEELTPVLPVEFQVPLVPQEPLMEPDLETPLARVPAPRRDDDTRAAREAALKRVRETAARLAAEPEPAPIEHLEQPAEELSEPAPSGPEGRELDRRTWPPRTTTTRIAEAAEQKTWPFDRPRVAPQPNRDDRLNRRQDAAVAEPRTPASLPAAPEISVAPAAVMRSGIISGMAYTLYADGSIDAELPLGTVHFASVEELRAHVARTGEDADSGFGHAHATS
jgi:hypothetical protein